MVNLMEAKDFGKSIEYAIRALTTITDRGAMSEVPTVANGNSLYHKLDLVQWDFIQF